MTLTPERQELMHGIVFEKFGDPEVLEYRNIPKPEPGPGEVRIRLKAIGVNFGDLIIRSGEAPIPIQLPMIPGSEAAGIVEKLGENAKGIEIGTRIAVPLFLSGRVQGGYAEYVVTTPDILFRLPDSLDFQEAAALQLQGFTALQLLEHVPALNKTVLVHAGAGGVGSILVQLLKASGAKKIIATASNPSKLALAKNLGADRTIDYTLPDWQETVRKETGGEGPDIVYDPVGGEIRSQSLEILNRKGTLVIYGISSTGKFEPISSEEIIGLYSKNQFVTGFSGWPLFTDTELVKNTFERLFRLVSNRIIRTQIGKTYSLQDAGLAHEELQSRRSLGKLLLIPD